MRWPDDFSEYVGELLEGVYDCVDRVVIRGYYPYGQTSGGMLKWWGDLHGTQVPLTDKALRAMAGNFSRRLRAYAAKHGIPMLSCADSGQKPFELAQAHLPRDSKFKGLFLIIVTRGPALVWDVRISPRHGTPQLRVKNPWPHVQHYHFHIIDPEWGHITIRMSGYPPFGVQVIANGHEWVERQARPRGVSFQKLDNCFVGGTFGPLQKIAGSLTDARVVQELTALADRWVYSACLSYALDLTEQDRSHFRYQYSCAQVEFSRNLLFRSGRQLDQVYQGLIERTRLHMDVPKLKTIFGRKNRPCSRTRRLERILDHSRWDLTVFKLHFGRLTLKMYDKGERVLRIEAIAYNVGDLRCGRRLEKLVVMLDKLQLMLTNFLSVVQAAYLSFLDQGALDRLPLPSQRGKTRLAGIDIQKPRMRAVLEALMALAASPDGFTADQLAQRVRKPRERDLCRYTPRRAAYDLRKLRAKDLVQRIGTTRRYHIQSPAVRTVAALLILREKVLKPILAGALKPHPGPRRQPTHPLDQHYLNLQLELIRTFQTLGIAHASLRC